MAKSRCQMKITGAKEILQEIEEMGKSVPLACADALETAGKMATVEYEKVISEHKYTGLTRDNLVENPKAKSAGAKVTVQTGFRIKGGGIASIFLDMGTPKQEPLYYIKKIKKNRAIKKAIMKKLEEPLK